MRLIELEKCVVEGAGAAGLAAILAGQLEELKGKKLVKKRISNKVFKLKNNILILFKGCIIVMWREY